MKTATILAIIALVMPTTGAGLFWAHAHGSEKQIANEGTISAVKLITAAVVRTNRDIRDLGKEVSDLKMKIERKHDNLIQVHLSSNKDPHIIDLKNQIERDIRDDERELEKKEKQLRDAEIKESRLIEHMTTA